MKVIPQYFIKVSPVYLLIIRRPLDDQDKKDMEGGGQ